MQSRVLAKKSILVSDPICQSMTDTQWLLEAEAMRFSEEQRYEELKILAEIFKKTMVTYLGLNIMPVEDEETGLLREPQDNEIIPLSVLCGRSEILEGVVNKRSDMSVQESVKDASRSGDFVEMSPEDLDTEMGDIDFANNPKDLEKILSWNSDVSKYVQSNLVDIIEDSSIKVETSESDSIKIVTDGVEHTVPPPKQFTIKIESD